MEARKDTDGHRCGWPMRSILFSRKGPARRKKSISFEFRKSTFFLLTVHALFCRRGTYRFSPCLCCLSPASPTRFVSGSLPCSWEQLNQQRLRMLTKPWDSQLSISGRQAMFLPLLMLSLGLQLHHIAGKKGQWVGPGDDDKDVVAPSQSWKWVCSPICGLSLRGSVANGYFK